MAQSLLGNIKNKHIVLDVSTGAVAAAVKLTKGLAVYQDAANGFKVVPTAAQPPSSEVRFVEVEQDNLTGLVGAKDVETYKSGTIMIVKAGDSIPIRSKLRASETVAGSLDALADPGDAALNAVFDDTEAEAALNANRDIDKFHVANYLGHPDEVGRVGKEVTAATVGQEILIQIL